MLVTIIDLI